ncbi:uncharacterized protein LOC62_01G001063 [Vanrija pseudolonga]|uniref:Uncharacterized protein n=1 Tax=Vanrija pseudolonga TaxID=143232 RepID=A0AAF0Y3R3_9TREE|nr:hypothetical protein LOC62_01G001063 [Vanrija pseudolonga]
MPLLPLLAAVLVATPALAAPYSYSYNSGPSGPPSWIFAPIIIFGVIVVGSIIASIVVSVASYAHGAKLRPPKAAVRRNSGPRTYVPPIPAMPPPLRVTQVYTVPTLPVYPGPAVTRPPAPAAPYPPVPPPPAPASGSGPAVRPMSPPPRSAPPAYTSTL